PGIDIETLLIVIWFTGAVVLIVRYLYKTNCFNLKIETIMKKSEPYLSDNYCDDINKYNISIYTGKLIEYPMTVKDAVILIPENLINDDNFDNILKHEIQHVKNRDLFFKKAINIICCIFWWFIPVYIIRKYFDILLEMRVDNEVTRNEDIGEYARSLIDVKKKILTDKMDKGLAAGMISEDSRTLEYRLKYLFAGNFKKRTSTILLIMVLLLPFVTNTVIFEPAFPSPYDNEPNVYVENEIKEKAYIIRHKNGTYGLMIDGNYAQLENIEAEPFCHLRVVYED
ncbi:MAG: M56 family metallopeptidase, partial [Erysipelotrichaceae bacterium]